MNIFQQVYYVVTAHCTDSEFHLANVRGQCARRALDEFDSTVCNQSMDDVVLLVDMSGNVRKRRSGLIAC